MKTRALHWLAMAAVAAAFVIARPAVARADQSMTCEVIEIVATKSDDPGIDPQLKDVSRKLKSKAFSAWNTFRQRARLAKQVQKGQTEDYDAPGAKVTVTLTDVIKKKKTRVALDISIQPKSGKSSGKSKSKIDAGDFVLFARGEDEAIITAVGCK